MGITEKQFKELCQRRSVKKAESIEPDFIKKRSKQGKDLVILGVDPSLRKTGYGIIKMSAGDTIAIDYGSIECLKEWTNSRCLVKIVEKLSELVESYKPEVCVIEGLFYAQNIKTALTMGEARGACLYAVARLGLEIYEIAPRKVKQAITGYGAAQKVSVAKMVQRLLNLREIPESDAADALAIALAFCLEIKGINVKPLKKI